MSISKNVNADVQNENATDYIDAEQTTLTGQKLKTTMNEETLKNGVYKRRYGAFGCNNHRQVYARAHYLPYLDDEYDEVIDRIDAEIDQFIEGEICPNCVVAYDRGHERGGEWEYRNQFNFGFESALEEIEKFIDKMKLTNECENVENIKKHLIEKIVNTMHKSNERENVAMTQKYIHENDCRYLNEFDIPYLNDLGCGYIDEEYVDVVEDEDEDEEIEAELAWYFEKLGILEDGICGTCIAAYHRGFERGGEWQFRVGKTLDLKVL